MVWQTSDLYDRLVLFCGRLGRLVKAGAAWALISHSYFQFVDAKALNSLGVEVLELKVRDRKLLGWLLVDPATSDGVIGSYLRRNVRWVRGRIKYFNEIGLLKGRKVVL